ncbi:MAG: DNA adenine methylase [Methanoregulaceae archaeon]
MAYTPTSLPCAKPFLKWAGGKTQLLREFEERLPPELENGKIEMYVEPFIGGGAMFFSLNRKYRFRRSVICDLNQELILCYAAIKSSVRDLIGRLEELESAYSNRDDAERKDLYYAIRDTFNRDRPGFDFSRKNPGRVERAAQLIFLNRTCYNGLFRVNRNGGFNVPFGRYKNPDILNEEILEEAAKVLRNTRIIHGDFTLCGKYADKGTFVYCDPPYRPINPTSSFTQYAKGGFTDSDQERLAMFIRDLDAKGVRVMLSNSDPKNADPDDPFFENLYCGFLQERVPARRSINCNGSRRGVINELIVTNYRSCP